MERRVYISQLLCPQRHAIIALSAECERPTEIAALEREVAKQIADLIAAKAINPRCGMCGALRESWVIETGRTRWATMAEATPPMREQEAKNIATGLIHGELGGRKRHE